jgi:hypothetical protein
MSFHDQTMLKTRIVFTQERDNGAGFAVREDDGARIYLTRYAVQAVRPEIGRLYWALLIPNSHSAALTPWFAAHLLADDVAETQFVERIHEALETGSIITGEWMADTHGGVAGVWDALLDAEYMAGGCSKFLRFDGPKSPPSRAWYSRDPDAADVDVWDDEQ